MSGKRRSSISFSAGFRRGSLTIQKKSNFETLRDALGKKVPGPNGAPDFTKLFDKWDTSNDGDISMMEFLKGVRKTSKLRPEQLTDQDIITLFREMDDDESNSIDREEFETWITRNPEEYQRHHILKRIETVEKATALFNEYDVDKGGYLSVDEFRPLIRNGLHMHLEEISNSSIHGLFEVIVQSPEGLSCEALCNWVAKPKSYEYEVTLNSEDVKIGEAFNAGPEGPVPLDETRRGSGALPEGQKTSEPVSGNPSRRTSLAPRSRRASLAPRAQSADMNPHTIKLLRTQDELRISQENLIESKHQLQGFNKDYQSALRLIQAIIKITEKGLPATLNTCDKLPEYLRAVIRPAVPVQTLSDSELDDLLGNLTEQLAFRPAAMSEKIRLIPIELSQLEQDQEELDELALDIPKVRPVLPHAKVLTGVLGLLTTLVAQLNQPVASSSASPSPQESEKKEAEGEKQVDLAAVADLAQKLHDAFHTLDAQLSTTNDELSSMFEEAAKLSNQVEPLVSLAIGAADPEAGGAVSTNKILQANMQLRRHVEQNQVTQTPL